ncbi:MAG: nucleotidyltransferase domain-containing protein [Chthoniobacteraceae bacterium]
MSAVLPTTANISTHPVLKPEVQATIDTAVERLVAEFKPEQIWLFGSYAWGDPNKDSDLDFIVVVPESDESALARAQRAQTRLWGIPMTMDVVVPTKKDFERVRHLKGSLTYKIVNEGRLLYGSGAD